MLAEKALTCTSTLLEFPVRAHNMPLRQRFLEILNADCKIIYSLIRDVVPDRLKPKIHQPLEE